MADKQAASAMIRIPTPLIDVVKELSRLHRQGKTQQLLQALGELIAAIDSDSDITIVTTDSSVIADLIARVERLEAGMMQPAIKQPATPQKSQKQRKQAIAPTDDESIDHAAAGWLTLKQVAVFVGVNYSNLSTKHREMGVGSAEFLDFLARKSAEAGNPQRWEFDRNLKKGMFRPQTG